MEACPQKPKLSIKCFRALPDRSVKYGAGPSSHRAYRQMLITAADPAPAEWVGDPAKVGAGQWNSPSRSARATAPARSLTSSLR